MKYDPCKFHGKFSDLIPAGFEFQKLYAKNYRQYCYEVTKYGNDIRVWQANGGTVEVLGMSSNATKNLYTMIKNGGIEQFEYQMGGWGGMPIETYYRWVVEIGTQNIEVHDYDKHDDMIAMFTLRDNEYDKNYIDAVVKSILDRYRKHICSVQDMKAVMMMVEKGFVIP